MRERGHSGWPWASSLALALAVSTGCTETIIADGSRAALLETGGATATAVPFFRDPLLSQPVLSPSGNQIAAIHSQDSLRTVIVRESRGGDIRRIWGLSYPGFSLRRLGWPGEDQVLVGVEMPHPKAIGVRARASRLVSIPLDGSQWKYLGEKWLHQAYTNFQDNIVDWLPTDPDHVLLGLHEPLQPGMSVFKVNVRNGRKSYAVQHRPSIRDWYADHRGVVRAGVGRRRVGRKYFFYARASEAEGFEKIIEYDPFEEDGFYFAGFSEDPWILYVMSNADTGRDALYTYDLRARQLGELVYSHPEYDLSHIVSAPDSDRLLAVRYWAERPEQYILDEAWRQEQARIDAQLPHTVNFVVQFSEDQDMAILHASSDVQPPRYYLYDRTAGELQLLFDAYPDIKPDALSPMRSVSYTARDGTLIHGYLTLPCGREPQALPAIVLPHGGPTTRDVWGYDRQVQFLASRGFAVLQPNFRGSTGYGNDFQVRGYQQWGLSMQDDVADGARWLIEEGIASPERIGIYGVSYGAYTAVMALVKTPGLFRAGAGFGGVYDLFSLLDDDEWYGLEDYNLPLIGDSWADRERLAATSPVHQAERIQAPVLLAHGTEDWRVHVRQAQNMADALRGAGKSVELHLYDKEIHGFHDERNRIDFYGKLAEFFERHLLGHAPGSQPANDSGPGPCEPKRQQLSPAGPANDPLTEQGGFRP